MKLSKKGVSNLLLLLLILSLLSLTLFSCTIKLAQNDTFVDMENAVLRQLEEPTEAAPAMVVHTTLGDIRAVLYPEVAPAYVEQFTTLAKSGYYDNTYIYQVEKGVYFEAGTPAPDGIPAESADHPLQHVKTEKSADLWSFRGAFCVPIVSKDTGYFKLLFNSAATYGGTRFLVCNTIKFDEETKAAMQEAGENAAAVTNGFLTLGGIPNYAQQMTVFAQTYGEESLAVIDAITSVATEKATEGTKYTAPKEDILITSIEIGTWGELAG